MNHGNDYSRTVSQARYKTKYGKRPKRIIPKKCFKDYQELSHM